MSKHSQGGQGQLVIAVEPPLKLGQKVRKGTAAIFKVALTTSKRRLPDWTIMVLLTADRFLSMMVDGKTCLTHSVRTEFG
jgi:hypothetical protein